jgi:N-acetylmuramic acid 6-phosphate etherase
MVDNGLVTEAGGDAAAAYEKRETLELVELMNEADSTVPAAVGAVAAHIAAVVDTVAERLRAGGRLVYVGAGSSGMIAALDASECEATFSVPPGVVVALVAGGAAIALEAEDDGESGARDVLAIQVGPADAVVGVSASGSTPYVVGALESARAAGAFTACVVAAPHSALGRLVEREIAVVVGPEFLAGSTRLKAGTAQKLVLNTISTVTMVRLGKTYGNLMVDVHASNEKLRARARRAVAVATGASDLEVDKALAAAEGDAKVAIVSLAANVDAEAARARLAAAGGVVRDALREKADVVGRV